MTRVYTLLKLAGLMSSVHASILHSLCAKQTVQYVSHIVGQLHAAVA